MIRSFVDCIEAVFVGNESREKWTHADSTLEANVEHREKAKDNQQLKSTFANQSRKAVRIK
ncbi:MAG: hypothetical protein E7015_00510 [Alphaproteobacteria bacterium]|nr:hypothetical protein [Alphaproteobacteria bacterium]